jgi:hypothetical protein
LIEVAGFQDEDDGQERQRVHPHHPPRTLLVGAIQRSKRKRITFLLNAAPRALRHGNIVSCPAARRHAALIATVASGSTRRQCFEQRLEFDMRKIIARLPEATLICVIQVAVARGLTIYALDPRRRKKPGEIALRARSGG